MDANGRKWTRKLGRKKGGQDERDLQDGIFRRLSFTAGPALAFAFQALSAEVQPGFSLKAGLLSIFRLPPSMGWRNRGWERDQARTTNGAANGHRSTGFRLGTSTVIARRHEVVTS